MINLKKGMWIIVNRNNERMYQFSAYSYEDLAFSALIRAREVYPEAGLKLAWIED